METESKKRPIITAGEESAKPLRKRKKKECCKKERSKLAETERDLYKVTEEKKKNNFSRRKGREKEKGSKPEATEVYQYNSGSKGESNREKKRGKFLRKEKRNKAGISKVDVYNEVDSVFDEQNGAPEDKENNERKLRKKKIKLQKKNKAEIDKANVYNEVDSVIDEQNGAPEDKENNKRKLRKKKIKQEKKKKAGIDKVSELHDEVEDDSREENGNSKKARKTKKEPRSSKKQEKTQENREETEQNDVYEISSGDEDCSRGMKKWITEYHQSRPGIEILQERIDDFITAYEAQEEQARKEREALAAEGGWTVVVHHKGRKKTTDTESGITVGSVAQAAVLENMAKKKSKDVGLDFYRFQKREAQRNEIMALQSKFEQDKKRIQQLRAARKFRPY